MLCISYLRCRETALLATPQLSSIRDLRYVAIVIAHEMAHMVRRSALYALPLCLDSCPSTCSVCSAACRDHQPHLPCHLQWFGDLVTMEYWGELWLNEGFASYFEHAGASAAHPEFK